MSHDHPNHAPDAVTHQQAPEAELPQAPPGAPEGHDAAPAQRHDAASAPGDAAAPVQGDGPGSPCDLEALAARAEKADEYLALAQRTKADFENYRKRATRETAAAQERGVAKLAKELLPAVDNLDRALEVAQHDGDNGASTLVSGIKLVHADVLAALSRAGIERFEPKGEQFDPQRHEAIAQQPVEGAKPGTIVEVYQRGYLLGDFVIRPARVVVAA